MEYIPFISGIGMCLILLFGDLGCFLNSYHWDEEGAVIWKWKEDGVFTINYFLPVH